VAFVDVGAGLLLAGLAATGRARATSIWSNPHQARQAVPGGFSIDYLAFDDVAAPAPAPSRHPQHISSPMQGVFGTACGVCSLALGAAPPASLNNQGIRPYACAPGALRKARTRLAQRISETRADCLTHLLTVLAWHRRFAIAAWPKTPCFTSARRTQPAQSSRLVYFILPFH